MATHPFYKSTKWKKKREKILRRDGYMCQVSKRYGKRIPATTVHHIYPLEDYPAYGLEDWNLLSVSMEINNRLHDRKSGNLTPLGIALMERTTPPERIPPT